MSILIKSLTQSTNFKKTYNFDVLNNKHSWQPHNYNDKNLIKNADHILWKIYLSISNHWKMTEHATPQLSN